LSAFYVFIFFSCLAPESEIDLRSTLLPLLSLLTSSIILYLGIGLMNVLVPVRMGLEGMATDTIGMVLSLFFVGMLIGANYSKKLIQRVGHIRTFAGSIAIEAICILAFALDTNAWLWGGLRILLGFSQACLLTAMESWLSDSATEKTRGKILSIYNGCILAGLFGGQFLIGVSNPAEDKLFIIVGILFTLAALPVLFSRAQAPSIETVAPMSIVTLFRLSPLGVASCLVAGIVYSALFNLLPVFAAEYQIAGFQLSVFMGCAILGAFILQFPVGYLSDRYDRRTVLFVLLIISSVAGLAVIPLAESGRIIGIFVLTGLTSGIIACLYPLSIAEAFDRVKNSEMVSAMGSMLLAFGLGGAIGPYTASLIMKLLGSASLFYFLSATQILLALFTLYRMSVRKALPVAEQEGFVMQAAEMSTTALDLDPRTEYIEPKAPLSHEAEAAVTIAETDPAAAVNMARALVVYYPEIGTEVAAAIATVPGIDVLRLYEVMKEAAPYQILETTQAIVKAKPDLAGELVSQLAEWYPQQVVPVAIEIGRVLPELRIEMARIAADSAPESATHVAEYYSRVIAEEREAVRPADRESDTSKADALNMISELWEVSPEQALDVAMVMVDAVPETAVSVAEEYIANSMHEPPDSQATADEVDYQGTVELVARISEIAPEQALDVAMAVVEAIPDSAAEVAAEVAGNIIDNDDGSECSAWAGDSSVNQAAVELTQRLSDASPYHVLDVAVAVVEALPDSAADVASEVAGNITDNDDGSENSVWAGDRSDSAAAVELTHRISDAAPENILDIAIAVVEALPEAASDVLDEISLGDEARESEWVDSIDSNSKQ
jgi:MFS family permease